jgi:hypothetical protein
MASLMIADWRQADFAELYDRWLELEALRQQVHQRAGAVANRQTFVARLRLLADDPGCVGAAWRAGDTWAGALVAQAAGSSASLALLILDLHASHSAAGRREMFNWLTAALRAKGVRTLMVALSRPLAVEEAMWLALGTRTDHHTYQVTL